MDSYTPFCFLNVLKPKGITSFDVIYKLRKKFSIKKIGHAGTLDPMASGVMQIAVGNAAKLLDYLPSNKEYIASLKFGFLSSTGDIEGEIAKSADPKFTLHELSETLKLFVGEITQTPPVYSAIKVNGKKLCDIARKTPTNELSLIEVPKRKVNIFEIELISFDKETYEAVIRVFCSKGTYIRTLAVDIANSLGTDSYLTDLVRTKAGKFSIEDSISIDNISIQENAINPINALDFPVYHLNEYEYKKVINGNPVVPREVSTLSENKHCLLCYDNRLVSLSVLSDNMLKCVKVFK